MQKEANDDNKQDHGHHRHFRLCEQDGGAVDAIPRREWFVDGVCDDNGEQDILQQRQWLVDRVVLQDGQHNLLQQREWFGGGIGHSDWVVGAIPGQGCANIYPYKGTF